MTQLCEPLRGVFMFEPSVFHDSRGAFVKTFHAQMFSDLGLPTVWCEEFFSISGKGVVRGMHFQSPPHHHGKLVYCLSGSVLDVILDLRISSPSFGHSTSVELSAKNRRILYIPEGFAHGFLALEDHSLMMYKTTVVHAPKYDLGIHWKSFGFAWPVAEAIVSERDANLPEFNNFKSPFP